MATEFAVCGVCKGVFDKKMATKYNKMLICSSTCLQNCKAYREKCRQNLILMEVTK